MFCNSFGSEKFIDRTCGFPPNTPKELLFTYLTPGDLQEGKAYVFTDYLTESNKRWGEKTLGQRFFLKTENHFPAESCKIPDPCHLTWSNLCDH